MGFEKSPRFFRAGGAGVSDGPPILAVERNRGSSYNGQVLDVRYGGVQTTGILQLPSVALLDRGREEGRSFLASYQRG